MRAQMPLITKEGYSFQLGMRMTMDPSIKSGRTAYVYDLSRTAWNEKAANHLRGITMRILIPSLALSKG